MKSRRTHLGRLAFVVAAMTPTTALAADNSSYGYYEINNGDGTCMTVSCGQNGCSVVDVHPCPKEVGDG